MPVVTIQQSPGRSKEQRQLLIKRITEAFGEAYELKPEAVTVFFKTLMTSIGEKVENYIKIDRKSVNQTVEGKLSHVRSTQRVSFIPS